MFCARCGKAISDELNYCKNCGAKIAKKADKDFTNSVLDNILTTLFLVVMFGLGILVGLVAVLLKNGVDHKAVMIISIFYLAAVFGICFMLLRQVPKLIDAKLQKNEKAEFAYPIQMSAPITAQLEEHREPISSVTENTTRTFDKIPLREN